MKYIIIWDTYRKNIVILLVRGLVFQTYWQNSNIDLYQILASLESNFLAFMLPDYDFCKKSKKWSFCSNSKWFHQCCLYLEDGSRIKRGWLQNFGDEASSVLMKEYLQWTAFMLCYRNTYFHFSKEHMVFMPKTTPDYSYQVQGQMGRGKAEWHDSYYIFFFHVKLSAVPCGKRLEAMLCCREDEYCQNWVIDNT